MLDVVTAITGSTPPWKKVWFLMHNRSDRWTLNIEFWCDDLFWIWRTDWLIYDFAHISWFSIIRWEEKRWRGCVYPPSQQPAGKSTNGSFPILLHLWQKSTIVFPSLLILDGQCVQRYLTTFESESISLTLSNSQRKIWEWQKRESLTWNF